MKKVVILSLIIAIGNYILFGISLAIFGEKSRSYGDTNYVSSRSYIFTEDIIESASWSVVNEFPSITINSAGAEVYINSTDDTMIGITASMPGEKRYHVEAYYEDQSNLVIETRPTNISFDGSENFGFGITNWLEDIFSNSSGIKILIEIPQSIFDYLSINQGSGSITAVDVNARNNNFNIGSGSFTFSNNPKFTARNFSVCLGSGNAYIANMQTEHYDIKIGSGSFDFRELSGTGSIDIGSGNGGIAYSDFSDDATLEMGSGNLTMYLNENGGAELEYYIGSGCIDIDAYDIKQTLKTLDDFDCLTIGNNFKESVFNINMGSGKVYIRDASTLSNDRDIIIPEIIIGPHHSATVASTSMMSSSSQDSDYPSEVDGSEQESDTSSSFEVTDDGGVPNAPSAPAAPNAPEAPNAPNAPNTPSEALHDTAS